MIHAPHIDERHAALLTVLVLWWAAWFLAAMWAEKRGLGAQVVLAAVVAALVALVVDSAQTALYCVQWVIFALAGVLFERRTR